MGGRAAALASLVRFGDGGAPCSDVAWHRRARRAAPVFPLLSGHRLRAGREAGKLLVERIEHHLAADGSPDARRDMKFVVAEGELAKLIGSEAVAALRSMGKAQLKALGADATARATFKLRRREAIAGTQAEPRPRSTYNDTTPWIRLQESCTSAKPLFIKL